MKYITIACILCFLLAVTNSQTDDDQLSIVKVIPLSQTAIQLQFDSELDPESAENHENYSITPKVEIDLVFLDDRPNRVLLITSQFEIGKTYKVTHKNVQSEIEFKLSAENEITFGSGNLVTFSGGLQDTSLIVNKDRKTHNNNVGAEPKLLCNPSGTVFFVAFDLFDAFEDMGIREPKQVLDATISLHAHKSDADAAQTVILRRVLLPWREGRGKSERAKENELTYNSSLHRNLPWNKPPAQAMLRGIDGDRASDYNGSDDVAHRIDGAFEIKPDGKRHSFKSELLLDAVRFWVANPDYNYGYLFALRDGKAPLVFSSKENTEEKLRPMLTIRYKTQSGAETDSPE